MAMAMETTDPSPPRTRCTDLLPVSSTPDSYRCSNVQLQLPAGTLCYPGGSQQGAPPLFVAQQSKSVMGLTATFTQLQVAAQFCYPPTPPVDMRTDHDAERMLMLQQQQQQQHHHVSEAPALSHLGYGAHTVEIEQPESTAADKNSFPSLPTPPELVPSPIAENGMDPNARSCSLSPQSCKETSQFFCKQPWPAMEASAHSQLSSPGMISGPSCSPHQWNAEPGISPGVSSSAMQPTFLLPVPHMATPECPTGKTWILPHCSVLEESCACMRTCTVTLV